MSPHLSKNLKKSIKKKGVIERKWEKSYFHQTKNKKEKRKKFLAKRVDSLELKQGPPRRNKHRAHHTPILTSPVIIRSSFEVPRSRVLRASSTQRTIFSCVWVGKEMASAVTGGGGGTAQKRRESTVTREGDQLVITPLGAGNEVGRSCVHMTYRGKTILVNLLILVFV